MAVRQVIGRDAGALAEFLKHWAGYARDVGNALIHSLGRRAQNDR